MKFEQSFSMRSVEERQRFFERNKWKLENAIASTVPAEKEAPVVEEKAEETPAEDETEEIVVMDANFDVEEDEETPHEDAPPSDEAEVTEDTNNEHVIVTEVDEDDVDMEIDDSDAIDLDSIDLDADIEF